MIEFDNVVSRPGYYLEEPSRVELAFQGHGAKLLGVEGEFSEAVYYRLFNGKNPEHDVPLVSRLSANRRGAFEFTFNMPKSPSIVSEIGGDTRIPQVQYEAVCKAMQKVERQVRVRVRKKAHLGESEKGWKYPERYTGNMVWVAFGHDTSRSGDPHTHIHVVIPNLTYDRVEKQWKAVELRHIDRQGIEREYTDGLVKGLRQLGYRVKREGKEFEIVGVPAEVKAEFSGRNRQIKDLQEGMEKKIDKPMSVKAKAKLSLYHRPEKRILDHQARLRSWVSRLTDGQFRGLKSLVSKARATIEQSRWAEGLKRHVAKLRAFGMDDRTNERQGHER